MGREKAVIYGFSLTPTRLEAVCLSQKDFRVVSQANVAIPPGTISPDGRRVSDEPQLTTSLMELCELIGYPLFSDPVYLAVLPPKLETSSVCLSEIEPLEGTLRTQVFTTGEIDDPMVIKQYTPLWSEGKNTAVAWSLADTGTAEAFVRVFYEAGLSLTSIEPLPLAITRGLAASGVLDALLRRMGTQRPWGFFGLAGDQLWIALWRGAQLVHITALEAPVSQGTLENALNAVALDVMEDSPACWLWWQDPGVMFGVEPATLRLGAPVFEALPGPLYKALVPVKVLASLGSALKPEIAFPLRWNYLADPSTAAFKAQYSIVPLQNYQPFIPKLLFRLGITALFMAVFLAGGAFWAQQHLKKDLAQAEQSYAQALAERQHRSQQILSRVSTWRPVTSPQQVSDTVTLEGLNRLTWEGALTGEAPPDDLRKRYQLRFCEPSQTLSDIQVTMSPMVMGKAEGTQFKIVGRILPHKGKVVPCAM